MVVRNCDWTHSLPDSSFFNDEFGNFRIHASDEVGWKVEISGLEEGGNLEIEKTCKIVVAIIWAVCFFPPVFSARVAELVDAHDSGSCGSNPVEVRFLSRAPLKKPLFL